MPFVTNAADGRGEAGRLAARRLLRTARREEYVLGLSGGIDSALAAYLAVEAVGADAVYCVFMPYRTSSPESLADAMKVVRGAGSENAHGGHHAHGRRL